MHFLKLLYQKMALYQHGAVLTFLCKYIKSLLFHLNDCPCSGQKSTVLPYEKYLWVNSLIWRKTTFI